MLVARCAWILSFSVGLLFASSARAQVVISEILASNQEIEVDPFGACSDWLELYNPSSSQVSLAGWKLKVGQDSGDGWRLPDIDLDPGGYLRIWCSGKDLDSPSDNLHTNFKLPAKGGVVSLYRPNDGSAEFVFDYRASPQFPDISFGLAHHFTEFDFLKNASLARFYVPEDGVLGEQWLRSSFDDSAWSQGMAPFGFDRKRHPSHANEIRKDLSMLVGADAGTVYLRFPFQLNQEQMGAIPLLSVRFKDGFSAYLNGQLIGSSGAPDALQWNSRATVVANSVMEWELDDGNLARVAEAMTLGSNVLAIQALSGGNKSRDLFVAPSLSGLKLESIQEDQLVYFDYPTPEEINGAGFTEIAPKPEFSKLGGIYLTSISVSIMLPSGEEGVIRYTLDGGFPDEDSAAYDGPIEIPVSTQLRARAFQHGKNPSLVTSEGYSFIGPSVQSFSSNLPLVVIDGLQEEIEEDDYSTMQMSVFDRGEDGRSRFTVAPTFTGRGGVKTRGSSTLDRPKKGYRIELRNQMDEDLDVGLLGMPADSDWILYGPYNFDQAMIRNALVYELSNQMGHYAVRTRFVEAFVKSDDQTLSMADYMGLFVMMEKIGLGKERVAIKRPPSDASDGGDLSGGYIFKIDRLGDDENGMRAGHHDLVHVSPNERDVTQAQSQWLTEYLDSFLDVLAGPSFADPKKGYRAFIDVDSWVEQHLVQEITRNPDAYRYSTFYTKPRGQKLRFGPAWDFDRAMRTNTDDEWVGRAARPTGWIWGGSYHWGKLMMDDPAYQRKFRQRGRELLSGVWSLTNIYKQIDRFAAVIAEAQERNHRRWGYLNPEEWRAEIALLKEWMSDRSDWLEQRFLPPPDVVGRTGRLIPPCELAMTTSEPGAQIYYTLDGSSPGLGTDKVSPKASLYQGSFKIEEDTLVTAAILSDGKWSDEKAVICVVKKPSLAITEIMYKPRMGGSFEFIELQNLGDEAVSLEDLTLSDAIDFDFSDGDVTELLPGEYVVVVSDLTFFKTSYSVGGIKIAGEFEGDLSNTSGRIVLSGAFGETIANVYYLDAWYPSTDGSGNSLVLKNPSLNPEQWRDPREWSASRERGGSPGRADVKGDLLAPDPQ
jgi:hypothetical protein